MIRESMKRDNGRVKWFNIYLYFGDQKTLIGKGFGKGTAWHMAKGLEHLYQDRDMYLLIE